MATLLSAAETTVLVAVTSHELREALVAMIGAVEGFRIVGEADSADQTLQLARSERPTLALVDEDLPGGSGTWTIERLCAEHLAQAVVALGWRASGANRTQAAGALVYVQMGGSPEDVLTALSSACGRPVTGRGTEN